MGNIQIVFHSLFLIKAQTVYWLVADGSGTALKISHVGNASLSNIHLSYTLGVPEIK